jgi:outer membrane protein W
MGRFNRLRHTRLIPAAVCVLAVSLACPSAEAQNQDTVYVGGLFGVSALSADARSVTMGAEAALSLYAPTNGLAVNVFGGVHLAQYFSVQANWMWNRNEVELVSSFTTALGGGFYEQRRHSAQHAIVLDGLIYFRRLDSAIRPYLGTGLSLLHFSSRDVVSSSSQGLSPPAGDLVSTHIGLRSHVGIDVRLSRRVTFRYSFSETISSNPISPSLTPPGQRGLMNFQNLFGFVTQF